ncbi:copper homeostasis CutC domain-containing protein [Biscogniauxia marginata]|nr:copper homeostasis CutC domain-containing protein [Biscogniauxia marginata]
MARVGLEVPVFGPSAAKRAVYLGASCVELNAAGSYAAGGLTPSLADLECVADLDVPLRIMIRPRGPPSRERDFIYHKEEFLQMARDIHQFKKSGLLREERGDGFVFGILKEAISTHLQDKPIETASNFGNVQQRKHTQLGQQEASTHTPRCWVDVERCTHLVKACRPFKAVFHRAFDEIVSSSEDSTVLSEHNSWDKALDDLSVCGFNAILTSGGLGKAIQNVTTLRSIIRKAEELGIEIIIGGGVRKTNIGELVERLELGTEDHRTIVHSACLSGDSGEEVDEDEVQGIVTHLQSSPTKSAVD